jgi:CheY-like chemotaxis protein
MKKRILVIDDEPAVRQTLTVLLQSDYRVVAAECGHAGVDAIAAFAFDVAIVDIFMPGMDGLETIGVIRQNAPDVPIIAMSGYVFGGEYLDLFDAAIELGATCCLHKPFTRKELIAAIEKCGAAPALAA